MFEGNATYLYVGNVARSTDTLAAMAAGSIAIVNEAGTVQTSTIMASNAKYRIAQKLASGQIIYSDWFNPTLIKNLTGKSYDAPVQQISYLGYNGTSGSFDATANEDFVMHVEWKNTAGFYNSYPFLVPATYHPSTASQAELTLGLIQSLDANMKRQPFKFVVVDRINSAAVVTSNDFLADATVVNGSKSISIAESSGAAADAGQYATSTETAVGDYLRIGGVGAGTALTSTVYKVTAVSGISTAAAVITVDRPITVASGTYAAATHDVEVIPAASIANFGLKFVGQTNATFDPMVDTYSLTNFGILLNESFVTATVTNSTAAYIGIGNPYVLANLEVYAQYNDKAPFISAYPRNNVRAEVDKTGTYDVMSFEVNDPVTTWVSTGMTTNKRTHMVIATKVALSGDGVDACLGFTL